MVTQVSENNPIALTELAQYKARSVRLRFLQVLSYGLGGATVFGLVGAVASKLLPLALGIGTATTEAAVTTATVTAGATAAAISLPALLGLGAIALLGIGCLYLSANFLSETTLLEQDLQAKKIGLATRGSLPTIETPSPNIPTLPSMASQQEPPSASATKWADRVGAAASDIPAKAAAAANASWAERASNDDHVTTQVRA